MAGDTANDCKCGLVSECSKFGHVTVGEGRLAAVTSELGHKYLLGWGLW